MQQGISAAWYEYPTEKYAHGVLGDSIEALGLGVDTTLLADSCGARHVRLDENHVFEDVRPHIADLDKDGAFEVITVRSHLAKGAQIAIWGQDQDTGALNLVATTPYIGTRNRWLAQLGAADLDGDGSMEIAYVDRPHLAKTLRIWRFADGAITQVAALEGFTNHRIGERDIAGGIRICRGNPEMILATADWSQMVAIRWDGKRFLRRDLGSDTSRPAFARAMRCAD